MIIATTCEEMSLLIQAEIDGELNAAQIASVTAHRGACAACEQVYQELVALRQTVRQDAARYTASADFRAALSARLRQEITPEPAAPHPWRRAFAEWRAGLSFGAGALVAAMLTLVVMTPSQPDLLTETVVSDHIRALQPGHLMDVISTDQHNVKPWFDGKLDFAPPVKDLKDKGFPLGGGRLDYLDGHAVAAIIYHSRQHPINLFVWPTPKPTADTEPKNEIHNGYNVIRWTQNDMTLWVVSDLNRGELNDFVRLWRQMP